MESNALFTYLAAMPSSNLYGIALLVIVVVGVGGASIWTQRAGEGSRLQSVLAALVLLAIAGLFGLTYWSRAKEGGGTSPT